MVDVWLIIVAVIAPVLLTVFNLVFLAKYIDPEHSKGHWITKGWVLFGLLLAEGTVLLLPLDVANKTGVAGCGFWNNECGGLNMSVAWNIVFIAVAATVVIIIPFLIFYYEADDEGMHADAQKKLKGTISKIASTRNCRRSLVSAICYTAITIIISLLVLVISFFFLRFTDIPYKQTTVWVGDQSWAPVNQAPSNPCGKSSGCSFSDETLELSVTFVIYMIALLSFVGWFIFAIYAGIGFVAEPLNAFNSFRHRPRVLTSKEARLKKKSLKDQADNLLQMGNELGKNVVEFRQSHSSRSERRKFRRAEGQEVNKYRLLVDEFEREVEEYQMCEPQNYKELYNPLIPWLKLLWGIIALIISLCWIIHIIVFILIDPPATPFLNDFFTWFDSWFPFLGTVFVMLFTLYLLNIVVTGNAKFGSRFFLIKVHPLVRHKTLINSFLFNVALILMTTLPVVQFATVAYSAYARLTDVSNIFGTQVKYMRFFKYFFASNAFIYAMLVIMFISFIYFMWCPSDRAHRQRLAQQVREKAQAQRSEAERRVAAAGGASIEMGDWGRK